MKISIQCLKCFFFIFQELDCLIIIFLFSVLVFEMAIKKKTLNKKKKIIIAVTRSRELIDGKH